MDKKGLIVIGGVVLGGLLLAQLVRSSQAQAAATNTAATQVPSAGASATLNASLTNIASGLQSLLSS